MGIAAARLGRRRRHPLTTTEKGPRRFYFEPNQKDPNAMDVDSITTEERTALMKKGACFICRMIGYLSRDCPNKKKNPPPKMKGKELHAHVRSEERRVGKEC